jgi:hypothetical protein
MVNKGKGKDDKVVEAIGPGGHVMKRRGRSRPVLQVVGECKLPPPSPSPTQVIVYLILFPSLTKICSCAALIGGWLLKPTQKSHTLYTHEMQILV